MDYREKRAKKPSYCLAREKELAEFDTRFEVLVVEKPDE